MKNKKLLFALLSLLVSLLLISCSADNYSSYDYDDDEQTEENDGFSSDDEILEGIEFLPYSKEDKWGYANNLGDVIVEPKYDDVGTGYKDSIIAPVQIGGKWGFVNAKGENVIPLKYDDVKQLDENFIKVKLSGLWGLIDRRGNSTLEPVFEEIYAYNNGFAKVLQNNKFGFIDTEGKLAVEPVFDMAEDFLQDGMAMVMVGEKYGFINTKGEYVLEPELDSIWDEINGISIYSVGEKKGYLRRTEKGIELLTDAVFDYAERFYNGVAAVEVDGLIGYIDEKGEYLIEPVIEYINDFGNGYASFRVDDSFGFLKYTDDGVEMLSEAEFDEVGEFSVETGLAPVRVDDLWGYVNENMKYVIDLQFIDALEFAPNGLAAVEVEEGWGYIDTDGDYAIEPKYSTAYSFESEERAPDYYQARVAYYVPGDGFKHIMIDETGKQTLYYWPS